MNRGAALALRLAAGFQAVEAVLGIVGFAATRWLWSTGDRSGTPFQTILHRYQMIAAVGNWSAVGCTIGTLVALALLCLALEGRARRFAGAALVAMTIHVSLMLFNQLVPAVASSTPPYRFPPLRQALWFVQLIGGYGSLLLMLLAATPPTDARRGVSRATVALAVLAGGILVFKIVSLAAPPPTGLLAEAFQYGWFAVDLGASVAFVLAAFWLAQPAAGSGAAQASLADGAPGVRDPRPLRLFGRTVILRIAAGVPLAIGATVATAQGAFDLGLVALVAATIVSVAVTAMLVTSLAGQRQLPAAICDREALTLAIVFACLAPVFDIWSAVSTGQLLSIVSEARQAASLWGMPSLSKIETLQATANWTGRISIGLGLAASFAIIRSLAATARGLGDETLTTRARRVRSLLVYGTGGAITAWFVVSNIELRGDGPLLLLVTIGVGLLTIGLVLVGEMLRLTYGLAAALERPTPPPEVSSAFPF